MSETVFSTYITKGGDERLVWIELSRDLVWKYIKRNEKLNLTYSEQLHSKNVYTKPLLEEFAAELGRRQKTCKKVMEKE